MTHGDNLVVEGVGEGRVLDDAAAGDVDDKCLAGGGGAWGAAAQGKAWEGGLLAALPPGRR